MFLFKILNVKICLIYLFDLNLRSNCKMTVVIVFYVINHP